MKQRLYEGKIVHLVGGLPVVKFRDTHTELLVLSGFPFLFSALLLLSSSVCVLRQATATLRVCLLLPELLASSSPLSLRERQRLILTMDQHVILVVKRRVGPAFHDHSMSVIRSFPLQ